MIVSGGYSIKNAGAPRVGRVATVTTNDHNDRVVHAHFFKFAAELRQSTLEKRRF